MDNLQNLLQRNNQSDQCFSLALEEGKRFLKASKDLKKGDLILEEVPLIRSPIKSTLPVCLGCLTPIDWQNCVYCCNCNFPMCCEECNNSSEHQMECQYFANIKVDGENFNYSTFEPMYDVILPLRVLSLKGSPGWQSFMGLTNYKEKLVCQQDWKQSHQFAMDYILQTLKLEDVTEDDLLTIFAIDHVNGITEDFSSYKVRLLHPLATLFSHSCQPNVEKYYSGLYNGNTLQCRAAVDIGKGETLTISYTDILNPTLIRHKILNQERFLDCKCKRCMDPSDLGTHGNSLICPKCHQGTLLPTHWKCDKCNEVHKNAQEVIEQAFMDAQDLVQDVNKWTVENYEFFLSKYAKILHANHVLMIKIKNKLAGFYGRLPGYTMLDMSMNRSLLDRKLKMCQDVLKNIELFQPGLGSLKAALLYEYHLPLFMGAKLDMDSMMDEECSTPIASPEQKEQFNKAIEYLEQSIDLLQYELEGTYENSLYYGAQGSLTQLKMFVDQLW